MTCDVMLLSLYKLQLFFLSEIKRSINKMGPYTLRADAQVAGTIS